MGRQRRSRTRAHLETPLTRPLTSTRLPNSYIYIYIYAHRTTPMFLPMLKAASFGLGFSGFARRIHRRRADCALDEGDEGAHT